MPGTDGDAPPVTGAGAPPATGDPDKTPKAGDKSTTPPATGDPKTDPAPTALTPEEIKELRESNDRMAAALKSANKEAEDRRKELKKVEDAKLTDDERSAAELAELRAEREAWQVERAETKVLAKVAAMAGSKGIIDPEAVAKLLDWDELDFDDSGNPLNLDKVVTALIEKKTYLVGTPTTPPPPKAPGTDAGAGTGAGAKPNLSQDELEQAEKSGISPDRYAALKGVTTLEDWQKTRRAPGGK